VLAVVVTVDVMDFEREFLTAAVERIEPDDVPFPGGS